MAGLVERLLGAYPVREVIVVNNGPAVALADGTIIEPGGPAVVVVEDPVAAVELLFGRLTRYTPYLWDGRFTDPTRPGGATRLGATVHVAAGVDLHHP